MEKSIYQIYKPASDNGLYIKLKDGDKVKLRIASEPAISVYKEGDKPRYSWVVFDRSSKKPMVYSSGVSVFSQIADLTEEWGDAQSFDIAIKRTGSGMSDTSYSVTPIKESEDLTSAELAEIEKIDLLQAIKGKWLKDFVDDGILPDAILAGEPKLDTIHTIPEGSEIPLEDIPF